MTVIEDFLAKVENVKKTGAATEHSYRASLEFLFGSLDDDVTALNEPKRVKVGAPDFLLQKGSLIIGHAEAKELGIDIGNLQGANAEQQNRYLKALPNLVYTNCLDFRFFREGKFIATVSIGRLAGNKIARDPAAFNTLFNLLKDFVRQRPRTITSPKLLAEIMAGKAILIKDVLTNSLAEDEDETTELYGQYLAFKQHLIHDITKQDFADIYAETLAYGMFAARLHDTSLDTFSRSKALELLPKSNPFLRNLFSYIAGPNLDERIRWIVDDLADAFHACDVNKVMAGFGRLTGQNDPFLHFYETFLAAYNPDKRRSRGVWYTPEPVVQYLVKAVDYILTEEFGLEDGLADTSKVMIEFDTGQTKLTKKGNMVASGKNQTEYKQVHRVQILDPAAGTGTFLAETIKVIAPKIKDIAEDLWSSYIEKDLVPRLHGFELLMASYAMCHLKLDMILTELDYKPTKNAPRLSVYLTNSLEEGEPANQSLPFAQWLSQEVKQANTIKRDMPIMCVIGNPPYAGETVNHGAWIADLMTSYKMEPGGTARLKERNSKWINDDYVKFMRLSEHLIERNGEGILSFITNHGYLDNPTFRGMRWRLMKSFDTIYVLDLHGNSKKKEMTPEGEPDRNVFDIQQGVALFVGVLKKDKSKKANLATVYHAELWGTREDKYNHLLEGFERTKWKTLSPQDPQYRFKPRNEKLFAQYMTGFSIRDLFVVGGTGIVTKRDKLSIHETQDGVWEAIQDMLTKPEEAVRKKYELPDDVRDWRYEWAKADAANNASRDKIQPIAYRPFDRRFIYYTGQARGFVGWPVERLMKHFILGTNVGLTTARSNKNPTPDHFFVTDVPMETKYAESSTQSAVFPLYLYREGELDNRPEINFDPKIFQDIRMSAGSKSGNLPNEMAVFDYIYGVLHTPEYRETFADFLKGDFPRVPYPSDRTEFDEIAQKGGELRRIHLLDPSALRKDSYKLAGSGDGIVTKMSYKDGNIWINKTQHFANVPEDAWDIQIGGYQVLYKWLKDRRGRALTTSEVKHYQRVINALVQTDEIMQTLLMPARVVSDADPM